MPASIAMQAACQRSRSAAVKWIAELAKGSDEVRRETVERRDIKAHLLEGEAALRSSMLSAADRLGAKLAGATSMRTNVGRNFANWRNFASRSSVKLRMINCLASGHQVLITSRCTLEGARNAEDPEEDEWGRYFHTKRPNRGRRCGGIATTVRFGRRGAAPDFGFERRNAARS